MTQISNFSLNYLSFILLQHQYQRTQTCPSQSLQCPSLLKSSNLFAPVAHHLDFPHSQYHFQGANLHTINLNQAKLHYVDFVQF
jgi:hypothetical protein